MIGTLLFGMFLVLAIEVIMVLVSNKFPLFILKLRKKAILYEIDLNVKSAKIEKKNLVNFEKAISELADE